MNLYTCKHFYPHALTILVALMFIIIGIFCILKKRDIKLTVAVFLVCVGIAAFIIYLFSYLDLYQNVFLAKDTEKLKTVEGTLTELETTGFWEGRYDKFYVDNIEFFVSANSGEPGYHKPAVYGGVLNKEGMYVKISYVEYENNRYIMSIDLIE